MIRLACALAAAGAMAGSVAPQPAAEQASGFVLQGAVEQGGLVRGIAPAGTTALTLDGDDVPVAADGRFLIAFDRDAGVSAVLRAQRAGGPPVVQTLSIEARRWPIERLARLPRRPLPDAEFEARRAPELVAIAAARARETGAQGWRDAFAWPARGRISGRFGAQRIYRDEAGAPHSGEDIAAPVGTPVVAPAEGTVVLATAAPFTLEGNLVIVDHGAGLNSAFLHLSRIEVREGDRLRAGDPIGQVGRSGRVTGPHLHWSLRWRDARIDPRTVVSASAATH